MPKISSKKIEFIRSEVSLPCILTLVFFILLQLANCLSFVRNIQENSKYVALKANTIVKDLSESGPDSDYENILFERLFLEDSSLPLFSSTSIVKPLAITSQLSSNRLFSCPMQVSESDSSTEGSKW